MRRVQVSWQKHHLYQRGSRQSRGGVKSLGSTEGSSDRPKGCLHYCQEQRPASCQCLYTVISKLERRGSPQRHPSQMAGNRRSWQPREAGRMERLGLSWDAQQLRTPVLQPSHSYPHPAQVLMAIMVLPPGSLPTDRHGILMSPGSSKRNKIQVVSKMTDCEGAKGPPLTAGLSWEALESRTDGRVVGQGYPSSLGTLSLLWTLVGLYLFIF